MSKYELGALTEPLLSWYEKNKRSMPWREDPTPYHVWISEIMLQQTRIEAVMGYYARFLDRLPDIASLAGVSDDELMKLWEGLGYYNRARNLKKAASQVMERHGGELPADYEKLKELAGVGNYTAGAIASIAYGVPAPAVDGNVLRVVMRFLNCADDISKMSVRREVERSIQAVVPAERPGDFNQALMELGEVVCIPGGAPLCEKCPLKKLCQGRAAGAQMKLPVKPKPRERRIEKRTVLLLEQAGEVCVRKRPDTGLLAGMWEFPSLAGHCGKAQIRKFLEEQGAEAESVERLPDAKHVFSHVEWRMRGYRILLSGDRPQDVVSGALFVKWDQLQREYALPVAFHAFLQV